jgi:hypothetical protein
MSGPTPDPRRCKKAIKILEQFQRLAHKLGIKISPERLKRLQALRDSGKIKSADLPAKLRLAFPGEFAGMTLETIRTRCGKK